MKTWGLFTLAVISFFYFNHPTKYSPNDCIQKPNQQSWFQVSKLENRTYFGTLVVSSARIPANIEESHLKGYKKITCPTVSHE